MKHTLTKTQAHKLRLKPGTVVDVELHNSNAITKNLRHENIKVASDVYHNGERIGGTINLND